MARVDDAQLVSLGCHKDHDGVADGPHSGVRISRDVMPFNTI